MRRSALAPLALLGLVVAPPSRAGDPPGRPFDYRESTLPNGLRVVTLEDRSSPIVAVQLWYHVGSKDEDPERQGFAHMFEHMMFRGSDRLGSAAHMDHVRKVGGSANAFTAFDQTAYVQEVPANALAMVLWMEAERMAFLKIDQAGFDTERKVVEEERRLGLNRPYGSALEKVLPELFAPHPYRWSPIGKIPHLRAASAGELRAFWTRYYVPNNATLVIVGDVSHAGALAEADRAFGWIPRGPDPARITPVVGKDEGPRTVAIKEDNAPTPGLAVVYRGVPAGHPDAVPLEMLGMILGGGSSSRLHRELVADRGLAVAAIAGAFGLEQAGLFGVGAVMAPIGPDPKAIREAIGRQVGRLRDDLVSAEEVAKVKNRMLKAEVAKTLTVASKAQALGTAAVVEGDLAKVNSRLAEVGSVTPEDLRRVARAYLVPRRETTFSVERNLLGSLLGRRGSRSEDDAPITARAEVDPPAPGRPGVVRPADLPASPPVPKPTTVDPTPRFVEETLPNGLRLIVVENHEVPFATVEVHWPSGAWDEAKPGLTSLTLSALTKGTAAYSEARLAEALDASAIALTGSAGHDSSVVHCDFLPAQADRAFELLGEVILRPTFPEAEFVKLKKEVRTGLAIESAQAEEQADRAFRREVFGAAHPYARKPSGDAREVEAATVADLAGRWREVGVPDGAFLIAAGDLSPDRLFALARSTFGGWKATPGDAPVAPRPTTPIAPTPPGPTRIVLVNRPGVQSQIRVGALGDSRRAIDRGAALVVGDYFGGGFHSRLFRVIRGEKGLTYGASGGFNPRRFAGDFQVRTFSKTESTVEAVKAVLAEVARLRDVPPTDDELSTTRSSTLGSIAGRFETPMAVASQVSNLILNGLPMSDTATTLAEVASIRPDRCAAYARDKVDPANLVIVVVGDAARLKDGLAAIAPVTVVAPGD